MRMLLNIKIPNEKFNAAVKDGSVGSKIRSILEITNPECVYFTDQDGHRSCILVTDVAEPSRVPALAEPWFLAFNANVEFHVAMTSEDLGKSGLEQLGKKWC
jgi:hypothetical protein